MEAFVYCWTDKKTNKLYVGSHKGSIDDGYVCSSKPMKQEYRIRPQDFSRQIIAEGAFQDIRLLEEKILKSANVMFNQYFYNMHNGNGNFYLKQHTNETKEKLKKLIKSKEHCEALSKSKKGIIPKCVFTREKYIGENNPNYEKKASEKTKEKMKNSQQKNIYVIDNIEYKFLEDIGKKYNISKSCVFGRLKSQSKKWLSWYYKDKPKITFKILKRPDVALNNKLRSKKNARN